MLWTQGIPQHLEMRVWVEGGGGSMWMLTSQISLSVGFLITFILAYMTKTIIAIISIPTSVINNPHHHHHYQHHICWHDVSCLR